MILLLSLGFRHFKVNGEITLATLWAYSADDKLIISYKLSLMETVCMKCQILFSGKNKGNISKCHLLKFLPRVLKVKWCF